MAASHKVVLVNTNRMRPPIAPVGLEYVAEALERDGRAVEIIDLAFADEPATELKSCLSECQPGLVGLSFRNVDDCFWPSGRSFLSELQSLVSEIRTLTDAPIVLGGVGFSIFAEAIVRQTGVEFGILGDGEIALPALLDAVSGNRRFNEVPGLVWRDGEFIRSNPPAWPTWSTTRRARRPGPHALGARGKKVAFAQP